VAAAFNNSVSRVAALIAVAGLGVVVSVIFRDALQVQTASLALAPEVQTTLQEAAQDPTGNVDRAQLPPEAREAVDVAYTEAFQRAMLTSAAAAFLGGAIAWLSIRRSPARRGDDARQESDRGRH
jgi:hypothetical protein